MFFFKDTEPSAKRAAYSDPPPGPESIAAQAAYTEALTVPGTQPRPLDFGVRPGVSECVLIVKLENKRNQFSLRSPSRVPYRTELIPRAPKGRHGPVTLNVGIRSVCLLFIAVPNTKLFAWGEGDSGGHVLRETTSRGLRGLVC